MIHMEHNLKRFNKLFMVKLLAYRVRHNAFDNFCEQADLPHEVKCGEF